jgi:LacI family transcriptional regulator
MVNSGAHQKARQSPPGRRPTIADVARAAQVSKATVSRVLNDKPDVDPATVATVLEVTKRLGYVPSSHAVGLARGTAQSLGLLAPSLSAPWMLEVLRGATEAIEASKFSLTLYTMADGLDSVDSLQTRIRAQAIEGLAVMQPPYEVRELQRLLGVGTPIVAIDARGAHPSLPCVASDDDGGIYSAVGHLIGLGRRRLGMIAGPGSIPCHRDRLRSFRDAVREAGLDDAPERQIVAATDTFPGGAVATQELLRRKPSLDGLVVSNDAMALAALRELRNAGVRVPDDVAVVGFDDVSASRYSDPPLTTVYNPLREIGATAIRLLLGAAQGIELPTHPVLLPTHLVIRGSTDPTAPSPEADLVHWAAEDPAQTPRVGDEPRGLMPGGSLRRTGPT